MSKKIVSREALLAIIEPLRGSKKIAFTSGSFDILHKGHVEYLEETKSHCDILIVGLNSDQSIKEYKSSLRPICGESERAAVLAALEVVDYVFIFSETKNHKNIELLKPDLYVKAGDYSPETLTSTPLVRAYGGDVLIIPFRSGHSTSNIIDKVLESYGLGRTTLLEKEPYEKRPAVFLDRDGTLNKHVEYLHEPEKFELLEGVREALKDLQAAGFRLVVVTNQAGIGLGYFSKEDFYRVNKELFKALGPHGITIDRVYFSPYSKADDTTCRKPNTGMVERAVEDLNLDLPNSFVVGDTTTDMKLAHNIGCPGILVETGYGGSDGVYDVQPAIKVPSLKEAAHYILSQQA
ncbi:MAG: HAD-IIIA family hydrolase [Bdellovibrionales bacterium]|nr:HAD-IIIA family hydrolase [Bdellovibrionales bacterium]